MWQVGQRVDDLFEDLRDGSRLSMLIELLTGEKLVCDSRKAGI